MIRVQHMRPLLQYKLSADYPDKYDWEYTAQGP